MIEATGLTKRYGKKTAVADLSFTVEPGCVTGFLGPNGAGKSTTMRMIMALDSPTAGKVTVNGKRYQSFTAPLQEVGALLEARAVHSGRSARAHLRALAATHGISNRRVDEVIEITGLGSVAKKRAGTFSLGMGQRLGIAAAILGDPQTLILDEPINGLDPEGVLWVRALIRSFADRGRTVFLSSHLMSEMAMSADRLIVIGQGRLIAEATVDEIIQATTTERVEVRSPHSATLAQLIAGPSVTITSTEPESLTVTGSSAEIIGQIAADNRIPLYQLTTVQATLEQAYLNLTKDAVEFASGVPANESLQGVR